jgi:hypothetical protein
MIKVKDGYAKLVGTTASGSASHILLSNGGVKSMSDFALKSELPDVSKYLPLTGGTISSPNFSPLYINRESTAASAIGFSNSTGKLGNLGFNDTTGPKWFDTSYTEFTIWHSGNDGRGSGLDADLLDGKHATDFMQYSTGGKYVQANLINSELWPLAGGNGYIEYYDSGTWFNSQWGKVTAHYGFEGSLSGNASSATKLQTPRTIWGQSFDGSGNVSGNLEMGISKVYWNNDASNYFITVNGAGKMYHTSYYGIFFRTGGSDRLAIDSTGNVGIGTISPSYKLDVAGSIQSSETVYGKAVTVIGNTVGPYLPNINWYDQTGNTGFHVSYRLNETAKPLRFYYKTGDTFT